ncbi:Xaa-Pro dipeptidase [Porphyridium purpureum]|uniref:Xaa-Pro dipeptidase n=1 Tax=Porphyridium purpureum TaxID=35688 RepID=A0A5J4YQY4_PORPP|nr:Xaa-Pro dipeptidase [Porphyridium purpureum]|eukprot:POR3863..scf296_7
MSATTLDGVFSMGQRTLRVPYALHAENRQRLVKRLVERALPTVGAADHDHWVLLEGGKATTRHATDHEHVFRQESFFQWCFGVREPDFYGALLLSGESYLFVPRMPTEYSIWMGALPTNAQLQTTYGVDHVMYIDEMKQCLLDRGPGKHVTLHVMHGVNSDSGNTHAPPSVVSDWITQPDKSFSPVTVDASSLLFEEMSACRSIKTEAELRVMRYASLVSSRAHVKCMQLVKPGMCEYELEAAFLHSAYSEGGCRHVSYTCICAGSGANSAILHYGHAARPNDGLIGRDSMLLMDMGAEYHCYASDITCSYPASGTFSPIQKVVYTAVLDASKTVLTALRPGASWLDMHILAERVILSHLLEHNIVKGGSLDELVEARVGALFMPHGMGHLIGLDTHDVGGYLTKNPPRSTLPGLKSLRTARLLEEHMVVTVEPGCYFVHALLDASVPLSEEYVNLRKFLNLEKLRDELDLVGDGKGWGVRIEDVVHITADGYELLSCVPREIEDVEAVMSGKSWPALDAKWQSMLQN